MAQIPLTEFVCPSHVVHLPPIPKYAPTTKFLLVNESKKSKAKSWTSPTLQVVFSDAWNPFLLCLTFKTQNVVSLGLFFGFLFSMFRWVSVVPLQLGQSALSVWSEQIHKTYFYKQRAIRGKFYDYDDFRKNSDTLSLRINVAAFSFLFYFDPISTGFISFIVCWLWWWLSTCFIKFKVLCSFLGQFLKWFNDKEESKIVFISIDHLSFHVNILCCPIYRKICFVIANAEFQPVI